MVENYMNEMRCFRGWLRGLLWADGSFIIQNPDYAGPKVTLVMRFDELSTMLFLKASLGYGTLHIHQQYENAPPLIHWGVQNKHDLRLFLMDLEQSYCPACELAGYIDGDGSFSIVYDKKHDIYHPVFSIGSRMDEPIIAQLAAYFEQKPTISDRYVNKAGYKGNIAYYLALGAKGKLMNLVQMLDEHPLRAKKAKDFAIWSQAVRIYCDEIAGPTRNEKLKALKDELETARKYIGPKTKEKAKELLKSVDKF